MAIAKLSAKRSKDPSKQVGACIVGANKVIIGIGYNGFPRGCDDQKLPWAKKSQDGPLGTKYPYVVLSLSLLPRLTAHAYTPMHYIVPVLFPVTSQTSQTYR
jgi:dCMP deaminase